MLLLLLYGAIRKTSKEHIFRELGLESLSDRRWYRRMSAFWKIVNGLSPAYLKTYLSLLQHSRKPIRQIYFHHLPNQPNILQTLSFLSLSTSGTN